MGEIIVCQASMAGVLLEQDLRGQQSAVFGSFVWVLGDMIFGFGLC